VLGNASGRCELAMALCGASHSFGLVRYSPEPLWGGLAMLSVSLLAASLRRA
jgi:hypothetical protein